MCIVYKNNPFNMMIHIIIFGKMWLRKSLRGLKHSSKLEFKLMKRKIYFVFYAEKSQFAPYKDGYPLVLSIKAATHSISISQPGRHTGACTKTGSIIGQRSLNKAETEA